MHVKYKSNLPVVFQAVSCRLYINFREYRRFVTVEVIYALEACVDVCLGQIPVIVGLDTDQCFHYA